MIEKLTAIFAVVLLVFFSFVLQYNRTLSFGGVNLNFFLVALIFFASVLQGPRLFLIVSLAIGTLAVLSAPFWAGEIALVFGIAVSFYFLRRLLSGNVFFDFLVFIFSGTILFYALHNLFHLSDLNLLVIALEVAANLTLAAVSFVLFSRFVYALEREK